ncbi:MAG TPA: glycoside hydrolase family 3 N-terminal domain-containing protein [Gemmatimonadaceae bacterium]|nr:glycoside hydrolase family 3 N-terminal domain-containing protein [Gemmatimonadaceae bacterium]
MSHSSLRSVIPGILMIVAACAQPAHSVPDESMLPSPVPPARSVVLATPAFTPGSPLTPEQRAWVDSTLETLDLRSRVAQMVHVWILGDFTNWDEPAFAEARGWVARDGVGGITMSLGSPIEVAEKINALQRIASVPLLVASDLEPGLGRLVGGVHVPSLLRGGSATLLTTNMAIGAAGREEDAFEAGRITGREARAIGITMAFSPTSDVNNNPANPVINTRSFGEDPRAVGMLAAAFVRGLQSEGVVATAKHFPGHGDTDTDSHLALPVVTSDRAQLDSVELRPFKAAIDAGVGAIMTAHIALPALGQPSTPATLVPEVISGLLRDSLGFGGMIVTDALTMEGVGKGYGVGESAVLAVKAGADVLLKPGDIPAAISAVVAAVESGDIPADRIATSTRRTLGMKARLGLHQDRYADLDVVRRVVGAPAHWEVAKGIAERAVTLLRDAGGLVPVPREGRIAVVTYAPELEVLAGRPFLAELRRLVPGATGVRISPRTGSAELDSLTRTMSGADRIIITTHVRTIEGEGRFAIPRHISKWIDGLAGPERVIVVANGNPYVIRDFPRVSSYLATYGIDPGLEQAAARALAGTIPITGTSPISLPEYFKRGDGISRSK